MLHLNMFPSLVLERVVVKAPFLKVIETLRLEFPGRVYLISIDQINNNSDI